MRHQMAHRKLGRTAGHRAALFRNQLASSLEHERIVTTLIKAKELRPIIENFFFQAEDGIRHLTVTGVQTCALPIFLWFAVKHGRSARATQPVSRGRPIANGIVSVKITAGVGWEFSPMSCGVLRCARDDHGWMLRIRSPGDALFPGVRIRGGSGNASRGSWAGHDSSLAARGSRRVPVRFTGAARDRAREFSFGSGYRDGARDIGRGAGRATFTGGDISRSNGFYAFSS